MFKVLDQICQPTRATKYSAMVDLYAREDVVIGAGETKIVPLGVKIDKGSIKDSLEDWEHIGGFMESHFIELHPRSSLRAKGLIIGVGVIDLDYVSHCKLNKTLNNGYCEHFKQKIKE